MRWCWDRGNVRVAGLVVAGLTALEWEARDFGEDSGKGLVADGADGLGVGSSSKNSGT